MYHSTEAALLRVHSDILQAVNKGQCVFLVFLHQSITFDMVELDILMKRLEESIGVTGPILQWYRSYFANRSQSVHVLCVPSVACLLSNGMTQGFVIRPFGFPMYTAPIGEICCKHGICYHFYANDNLLYLAFKPKDEDEAIHCLGECTCEIRNLMGKNHLQLNDSKMEFIIIRYHTKLHQLSGNDGIKIGDSIIKASPLARNIGAIFDCPLIMKDHIHAMCRACYCHIRHIGKVRSYLTKDAAITLIHAFVP